MSAIIHADGFILLAQSLVLALLGHQVHRWRWRIPLFVVAGSDFALGISLLGLYRPTDLGAWHFFRIFADSATFGFIALYVFTRAFPKFAQRSPNSAPGAHPVLH